MKSTINMTFFFGICLMLVGLSLGLSGCEPDGKYKEYVYPEPVVDGITPASGYVASQVAITGTNFGDRTEPVKVAFGGIKADSIISISNSCIVVLVPEGAVSGKVSLEVWTHTLDSVGSYTVIPTPEIYSIASSNAAGESFAVGGDVVTITGTAFGTDESVVEVTINEVEAEILSMSNTEIKVTVPENYGSGVLVLTINGYSIEGSSLIDPTLTGDVTRLFLKNYCQPFERTDATSETEWDDALYWVKNSLYTGNSLQFTDDVPDGMITLIGRNSSWNSALYQLASLPAGTYEATVKVIDRYHASGRYGAVFGIVKGEASFPDLTGSSTWTFSESEDVLCEINLVGSDYEEEDGLMVFTGDEFTVTETTSVTIGFAMMLAVNNYVKLTDIRIIRK